MTTKKPRPAKSQATSAVATPAATTAPAAPVASPAPSSARTASITVGLVKGPDLPSRLIAWWGGGGWSHFVAMVLPGGRYVIDARSDRVGGAPPGVQVRDITYLRGYECLWLEVPCTPEQATASETNLRSVLDHAYNKVGIFDFATGAADKTSNGGSFFCSQLGSWNFARLGLLQGDLIPFSKVDPGAGLAVCWGLGARKAETPIGLR